MIARASRPYIPLLLVIVVACQDAPTAQRRDTDSVPPPPPPPASLCRNTSVDLSEVSFIRNPLLHCGAQLGVSLGATPASFTQANRNAVLSALGSAVRTWNSVLGTPQVGLFRLDSVGSGGIVIDIESLDPAVNCGQTDPGSTRITLRSSPCNGNYASLADLQNLIVHELAHVIGFDGAQWHSGASDSVRGNCASHLPSQDRAAINGSICALEMETIYYSYGIRTSVPNIRRHVIAGLAGLPARLTLAPGSSTTLEVTGLRTDAPFCQVPGGVEPGPMRSQRGDCELSPQGVTLGWAVSGSGLTVTASGSNGTLDLASDAHPGRLTVTVSATGPHQLAAFFQIGEVDVDVIAD